MNGLSRQKESVKMLTKDDITIMVFAYRYAVGRMTYAPSLVCDYIASKVSEMTDQQIEELIDEVKKTIQYQDYADDIALNEVNKLYCCLRRGNIHITHWFFDEEGEQVWAHVVHNNRYCYWGCKTNDVFPPNYDRNYEDDKKSKKLLLDKIIRDDFDPAKLPHIEEASPAMQHLWRSITYSENCMLFVDDDEFEFSSYYEDLKLTKEEFQRQVDADIKKYHLEDVITKYEDATMMYTCYGDLQTKFSGSNTL